MMMLRQAAMMPRLASHPTRRSYATQSKFVSCPAASCLRRAAPLRPSTAANFTAAAVCVTATPRRWCSSAVGTRDYTEAGSTNTRHASAAAADARESKAAPMPPAKFSAAESATSVAAQLSALSAEDQSRILSALQHPEKEKGSVMGGAGIGPAAGDMVAAFTCGPCDYRMVKRFSKHAYTKGIVIVECPNCRAKHLLADNLGWLENEARNIEDILREKGERFIRINGTSGDYEAVSDDKAAAAPAGASPTTAKE